MIDLRKTLLAGTALVAVAGFTASAQAADTDPEGTFAAPTNLLTGLTSSDSIVNTATANNDAGEINVDDGVSVVTINSTNDGLIAVYDGTNDTADGDTLTVTTFADIETGTTLTFVLGASEQDGNAADTTGAEEANVLITTTLGDNGATTLTRGGSVTVRGADDNTTAGAAEHDFNVNGNTLLTTLSILGGAGGANNNAGTAVNATFGDASTDTLDVTGLVVTGGAANAAGDDPGGAAAFTSTGAATVGTGNVAVTGGAGADNAVGGAASATFSNGLTISGAGTLTVAGGNAAAAGAAAAGGASSTTVTGELSMGSGNITVTGGDDGVFNGGDASLTVTSNVTTTGNIVLSTGTGGNGGVEGDATVTFGGNVSAAATTFEVGADAGAASITLNGTSAQTYAGTIDGATGAEGTITVDNASGVTFSGTIGAGNGIAGITVEKATGNSSATFQNTVTSPITLGGADGSGSGTDTNTVTFDSTTQAFTVTGAIAGAIAGEVNNIVVTGDDVVTFATAATSNLDNLAVNSTSTLTTGQNLTVTATTIASGATLITTGNTLDTAVTLTGTLRANGGDITGDVDGSAANTGTLDIADDATFTGSAGTTNGLSTITIEEDADFDVTAAAAARTVKASSIVLEDAASDGNDAEFNLAPGANGIDVTAAITTQVAGEGLIVIQDGAGAVDFVGDIGTSSANVGTMTSAGDLVTFTDDVYVAAITTTDAADTLQFLGATGTTQIVSGTIDDDGADNQGDIAVGDDTLAPTVRFNGIIGGTQDLRNLTVNTNSTAYLTANAFFDTLVTVDAGATLRIGQGATLDTAQLTPAATAGIDIDVVDADGALAAADFGQINDANNGAIDTDIVTFRPTGAISAGTVDILTGATFDEAKAATDTSALYSFTVATNGNVTVAADSTGVTTASTAGFATVLDSFLGNIGSNNADVETFIDNVAAATGDAASEVVESAVPTVDAGAVTAAVSVANGSAGVTGGRLASLRNGTAGETGMVAGNISEGLSAWTQLFGQTAEQDRRDNVDGYESDTVGVSFGIDTETLAEDWVWGLGFTYASTDVDSDNANNTETEVDSYQLTLYGEYDYDDRTYISGQLGYVWSDNDTTRENVGGITGRTATGDFDSQQIVARLEAGRSYEAGNGATLTPSVLLNYMNYDADDYTETGAGGLNLQNVDTDNLNILEIGVGLDAEWVYEQADGGYMKPNLHAGVRYDVIGDEVESTASFTGGGASFKTEGFDPAQATFNVGAGVTYFTTSNWELSAGYDFEYKSDYDAHAGTLKASYKF